MGKESEATVIPQIRQIYYDLYANFPAANTVRIGDLAYATDRRCLYRSSGAAWQEITIHSSSGIAANIPAAATMPEGSLYYATDTNVLSQIQTGAWVVIITSIDGRQSFKNLLMNGDFEIGDPPINWTLVGVGATLVRSNVQALINTYSALLTRIGADCYLQQVIADPTRYQGRIITLGCWVWASVADRARLALNDGIDIDNSAFHTGGSTWEWLTITHTVNAGSGILQARGWILTGNTAAYFDGAILVEGSICPAFSPKPAELFIEETEVHNGNSPVAWTDLDLSAVVGDNPALVLLKFTRPGGATENMAVRRNGDADQFYSVDVEPKGTALIGMPINIHAALWVATDEHGIIEWITSLAEVDVIDVMAYIR